MTATGSVEGLAKFAREVHAAHSEDDRLQAAVHSAVELVTGADHAGVSMVDHKVITTGAATSDLVWKGDQLQYELDQGPCLDSLHDHTTILSQDLLADRRWPAWSRRVVSELGVESMLSLLLYTDGKSYGALNLYGTHRDAFDSDDLEVAQALASHIAVALAMTREISQRGAAMLNRTVIGQAEGILMERLSISAEQAFAFLRRISQQENRKLVTVAAELVETRELPGQQQH